jgi:hypothetical protein
VEGGNSKYDPIKNDACLRGCSHSRQAKNMGGWCMREISIYKLQIPNKLQKANYNSQTKAKNQYRNRLVWVIL